MMRKVIVGMSGGVDSSVAALLLHRQGYKVTGVYMRNWDSADEMAQSKCPSSLEFQDVQQVCDQIGIPCQQVDFVQPYWNNVFSPCLDTFDLGHTPNPDVLCNREIKFKVFRDFAKTLDASAIATGHYARLVNSQLFMAKDLVKDQTYFLSGVPFFENVLFPLGDYLKSEVRDIATDAGLCTASKAESMGICFIGKRNFPEFIHDYIESRPGRLVSIQDGKDMGSHEGLSNYTIGQGAKLAGMPEKWFVVKKDTSNGTVYVAPGTKHPALYVDQISSKQFNWITPPPSDQFECLYRIRHRQKVGKCSVTLDGESDIHVEFESPHRGIALHQMVTLYRSDGLCYGGGLIVDSGPTYFDQDKPLPSTVSDWSCS